MFTPEQIEQFQKDIMSGNIPPELQKMQQDAMQNRFTDKDGNPIIDEEGGAVVQPTHGFVVKSKD